MKKTLLCALALLLLCACAPARAETATTVMVYMSGSDIADDALADVLEMCEAGAGENVIITLLAGGSADWEEVFTPRRLNRCVIHEGEIYNLETLPSRSMGAPDTLTDFITWSMTEYTADRYILILWDHGGGAASGVCWDDTWRDDFLTLREIGQALDACRKQDPSFHLDMIGFDACLMGNFETAVHVRSFADYMVASEELVPSSGWNYEWLGDLGARPDMDTQAVGVSIADRFVDFCLLEDPNDYVSMSVVYLPALDALTAIWEDYSACLIQALENGQLAAFSRAQRRMYSFGSYWEDSESGCVDMMAFLNGTRQFAPETAKEVERAYKQAVRYSAGSRNFDYLTGLSVFFPKSRWDLEEMSMGDDLPNHLQFIRGYTALKAGNAYVFDIPAPAHESGEAAVTFISSPASFDLPDAAFTAQEPPEQQSGRETASFPDAPTLLPPVASTLTDNPNAQAGGVEPEAENAVSFDFAGGNPIGGYSITLAPDEMAHLAEAHGLLYLYDIIDDEDGLMILWIEMGVMQNAAIDWENNRVISLYDGTLPFLGEEMVAMYDTMNSGGLRRAVIPVLYNGREGYLMVTKTPATRDWVIVGFSQGYGENGIPARGTEKLMEGDVIIPLFTAYAMMEDDEDVTEFTFEGETVTVGPGGTISLAFEDMTGGGETLSYMFCFELTDIYGGTQQSELVDFEM